MESGEALGIAAQIGVALAGFAGVVVVFRRESVHESFCHSSLASLFSLLLRCSSLRELFWCRRNSAVT